ncbi:MAG: glycerol-3-phosphate acyltransferase [Clostridiales bacterium]|nr:glycerol-3-phosphate acyltransferase [Clostridiales bacterium]
MPEWLITAFLYIGICLAAYLICALNPAVIMARLIYHEDIRTKGSGNPGFTNFKRVYGNKVAWFVFGLDIGKTILVMVFGIMALKTANPDHQSCAAIIGFCALMGHVFPCWYKFRGGKGFLVWATAIFFCDWKAGLVALAVMAAFLFTKWYMSLATMCFCASGTIAIIAFDFIFGQDPSLIPLIAFIMLAGTAVVILRHKENIIKLRNGTESKFSFRGSKKTEEQVPSAENS